MTTDTDDQREGSYPAAARAALTQDELDELDELARLEAAATPNLHPDTWGSSAVLGDFEGKTELIAQFGGTSWSQLNNGKNDRYRAQIKIDMAFYMAARNALPRLLADRQRLEAERDHWHALYGAALGDIVQLHSAISTAEADRQRLADECERLRVALESLRRSHYQCEDCWYSCPKCSEGCCDDSQTECNCGADEYNARIDAVLAARPDGAAPAQPAGGGTKAEG